ncbi:MAG: prenyltransferase/squalene oxidase repeat-containing protein, partial [Terriglobales bacterium]
YAGDAAALRLLLQHRPAASGVPLALQLSLKSDCGACFDLLAASADAAARNALLFGAVPPRGDGAGLRPLLHPGVEVNARDREGRSLLMLASIAEGTTPATIQTLLDRGAEIGATSPAGANALDFAQRLGRTANVALLRKAGAVPTPIAREALPVPSPAPDAGAAVARSLPLLQRVDVTFLSKSGCVSCHNNSFTALSVVAARQHGMQVDRETEQHQTRAIGAYLDTWHERALQHIGIPGHADTMSYLLLGMGAEGYVPNLATDAMAHYLRVRQNPDGHWTVLAHRPPMESSNIEVTAVCMHALQVFAPKAWKPDFDQAVRLAASWLTAAAPRSTEDRAYQLLGLDWAHAARPTIRNAARALIAEQRPDGGWAQLALLDSDAYATGEALVSLRQSGALTAADPVYRRGVQYLLHTQMADGSWFVPSRAIPIQPYFDSGFPYGRDQFISAAATNWATRALLAGSYPLSAAR